MKTKLIIYTILFSAMLCLQHCQCKKDDAMPSPQPAPLPQLPPITTSGANTFGCKLNGKVWLPYSSTSAFFPMNASLDKAHNMTLLISADIKNGNLKEEISLNIGNITSDTTRLLSKYPKNYGYYYLFDSYKTYITDSINNGFITILRFDSIKQIISGTFYFNAYDSVSKQAVNITDGRFDMQFSY